MPVPALPRPRPKRAPFTRLFVDVLGRPLSGDVRITPVRNSVRGPAYFANVDVTCTLVDGMLRVDLPPGSYELAGLLETVDGELHRLSVSADVP